MYQKTTEQEVFDYLVKFEEWHFQQSEKHGILPSTKTLRERFGISKAGANNYLNEIARRFRENRRSKPLSRLEKIMRVIKK